MGFGIIPRHLQPAEIASKKSIFLFGPRQTGKSTLIKQSLPEAPLFDLLDSETFFPLSQRPSLLREQIPQSTQLVVIDEIQKLPILLDAK